MARALKIKKKLTGVSISLDGPNALVVKLAAKAEVLADYFGNVCGAPDSDESDDEVEVMVGNILSSLPSLGRPPVTKKELQQFIKTQ